MDENKKILKSNNNRHSILDEIEKKSDFSTPKDYFESLPEVTSTNILNKNKLYNNFDILSYRVLLPTLMILLLTIFVFNWNSDSEKNELTNEQLSEVLIESDYVDFDDELLYEVYSKTLTEEEKNNEYIEYLIENNVELNTIIDEL